MKRKLSTVMLLVQLAVHVEVETFQFALDSVCLVHSPRRSIAWLYGTACKRLPLQAPSFFCLFSFSMRADPIRALRGFLRCEQPTGLPLPSCAYREHRDLEGGVGDGRQASCCQYLPIGCRRGRHKRRWKTTPPFRLVWNLPAMFRATLGTNSTFYWSAVFKCPRSYCSSAVQVLRRYCAVVDGESCSTFDFDIMYCTDKPRPSKQICSHERECGAR